MDGERLGSVAELCGALVGPWPCMLGKGHTDQHEAQSGSFWGCPRCNWTYLFELGEVLSQKQMIFRMHNKNVHGDEQKEGVSVASVKPVRQESVYFEDTIVRMVARLAYSQRRTAEAIYLHGNEDNLPALQGTMNKINEMIDFLFVGLQKIHKDWWLSEDES